jgi:DNA-binding transcriptional LysR family regulator
MAIFARVVEAKSFTLAARALSVSKSVVSKRVSALETLLGVRLLHRTTRRLSLTPEGVRLYERCLNMLRGADEALELVQGTAEEPRGILRISSNLIFSDLYLAEIITSFVKRHPHVQVELTANNNMVDLVDERVDVAIRLAPMLASSSLVARRLATTPKIVCASPAYLAEHGTPETPDDLRGHACLRFSPLPSEVEWKFRVGRLTSIIPVSGPISADTPEVLRRAALAGTGIIILPLFFVAEELAEGRLVPLLDAYPVPELGVFAVYSKGKVVPAKVRKFVDYVAARLRSAPWEEAVNKRKILARHAGS